MRAMIFQMLRAYLDREIDFDTFEDRVILLAWESQGADLDTVDQVAAEIACVKDGVLDEDTFRARIGEMAAQGTDMVWQIYLLPKESRTSIRTIQHSSDTCLSYQEPAGTVNHHLSLRLEL